jgi:hypothetical protein
MDRLIAQETSGPADAPEREAKILSDKLGECARLRAAYQDQQAAGLMTIEELADKLKELEGVKVLAETELANLSERRHRADELHQDKEALLAFRSEAVVKGLDELTSEQKSEVYRLLKLEVSPTPEGLQASGALLCSETLPVEKASGLLPFSDASSGLSQYFASATAKALPLSNSSVSVLSLFAATDLASL